MNIRAGAGSACGMFQQQDVECSGSLAKQDAGTKSEAANSAQMLSLIGSRARDEKLVGLFV